MKWYQEALRLRKQLGDRVGQGTTLNNLGSVYYNKRDYQSALDVYQQALALRQADNDFRGQANTLSNIGFVCHAAGQREKNRNRAGEWYSKALEYYQAALKIQQKLGDRAGEEIALYNIGKIYNSQGNQLKAQDYYRQALKIREEMGGKSGGIIKGNIRAIESN